MLHDDLKNLGHYPFHMPGHKRNEKFNILGSEIDITEIEDFDNLHCAQKSIKEIEDALAQIYGASRSFMLVNGSTVGILAAIFAVTQRGDKIIIARNCHKSVYNACFLRELDVIYIEADYDEDDGYYTSISQKAINNAVRKNPDAVAAVITSPTYEGNISNVTADIPLIIDCAHGAHFGFGSFPKYPNKDIVISSLHKTLPSLTQTAVLNVFNKEYTERIKMYIDIFETSSPSYVLMNSVSRCIDILKNSDKLFMDYENNLDEFYKTELYNLSFKIGDDKGKIVVSCSKTNLSGAQLADIMRNEYSIECEMASSNYVIFMTSVADTKYGFDMLSNALIEIDRKAIKRKPEKISKVPLPYKACKACDVKYKEKTELREAHGKTCAEYVYAYPPGIPIIVPGEVISDEIIDEIENMMKKGVNISSDSNLLPDFILTKHDK